MDIELTKEQRKEIDHLFIKAQAYKQTIQDLSEKASEITSLAWEKIKQWYPETDKPSRSKNPLLYDHQKGILSQLSDIGI